MDMIDKMDKISDCGRFTTEATEDTETPVYLGREIVENNGISARRDGADEECVQHEPPRG